MNHLKKHWVLDPDIVFLNHGSFGACPQVVLEHQNRLRQELEHEPLRFMLRELPELWDNARNTLAAFLTADPQGLAFVRNATTGINSVLRSYPLQPGDEILVTDHSYNACSNAVEFVAQRSGARVVKVALPYPGTTKEGLIDAILSAVTPKTRLAMLDHVTSHSAIIMPIEKLVGALQNRGVEVLVDGAHAPGMLDLDLDALGAEFYTGNCHKWLCAPKGSAFLWVREDKRQQVRPAVISHGANAPTTEKSRFHWEFDWVGTDDPTPWLCIPQAIATMAGLVKGGWPEIRKRNGQLVRRGQQILLADLGLEAPCADDLIGSMAILPLPPNANDTMATHFEIPPLQDALFQKFGIELPVFPFPAPPTRWMRISAQLYNDETDYQRLRDALNQLL